MRYQGRYLATWICVLSVIAQNANATFDSSKFTENDHVSWLSQKPDIKSHTSDKGLLVINGFMDDNHISQFESYFLKEDGTAFTGENLFFDLEDGQIPQELASQIELADVEAFINFGNLETVDYQTRIDLIRKTRDDFAIGYEAWKNEPEWHTSKTTLTLMQRDEQDSDTSDDIELKFSDQVNVVVTPDPIATGEGWKLYAVGIESV